MGGLFTVLMCADCQAARGHGSGPYPVMTRAEMRAGLDLLPTWALEQKAAANRQVIAVMRMRLAAGEQVARMYQEPGAGLAGAPSRGRRGPGRRAPGGSEAPPLMWLWPHDGLCRDAPVDGHAVSAWVLDGCNAVKTSRAT